MSTDRTRVVGWGPFRLPGEKRRRAEAAKRATDDLLRAYGSIDAEGNPVSIDWGDATLPPSPHAAAPLRQETTMSEQRRRYRRCAEAFGIEGAYDPACCRFPKSCSPYPYQEAIDAGNVTDADLEDPR